MKDYKSFAVIIIVTDIEENAVKNMYDWKKLIYDDDEQLYYETYFEDKYLIYAKQDELGMTASSSLAMKCIERFRPKYLIMPGIAGGTYEEGRFYEMYGDVVLADMVWNHSNGKLIAREEKDEFYGKLAFESRPTKINIDKDIIDRIKKFINTKENQNFVHIGSIASGYAVIADKSIIDKKIMIQVDNTVGVEMEGYGIAYAATHSTLPKPKPIIAKGICDFADKDKSNLYQKFAAYTSCEFVKYLIKNVLE